MFRSLSLLRHSSFFLPMQWMNASQRRAMKALYGFCRHIDDIADGEGSRAEKHAALDVVAAQIATIYEGGNIDQNHEALAQTAHKYGMRRDYMDELIAGMRMDVDGPIVWPSEEELEQYCYRAAGCVGLLALPIFGHETEQAKRFARALGHALQLTNILRDVVTDAHMGRIYLAHEWTKEKASAEQIADDPKQAYGACVKALEKARYYYEQTAQLLDNAQALRPALMMRETYKQLLLQMEKDGFSYAQHYQLSAFLRVKGCVSALFMPGGSRQ